MVSALLFAGWKFTHGLELVQDIALFDETGYLNAGLHLHSLGLPHAESAPLYAIWYYVLSFLRADPVALFYLNFKALTTLLPLSLYAVLRRYQCPLLPAVIIAFLFLISGANLAVGPKVSQFAVLVILASLFVASFAQSNTARLAIITGGALLSSYARPELFFAFALLFVLSVGVFLVKERHVSNLSSVLGLAVGSILLIAALGVPPSGGWRSSMAFAQHFSLNWVSWTHNTELSPWDDWQEIVARNFGGAQSITDAARNNPPLFVNHLVYNALNIPRPLIREFFRHANILLPFEYQDVEANLLLLAVILSVVVAYRQNLRELPARLRAEKLIALALGCYLVVSLVSVILIYPDEHYLLITGILLIVLVALLITPEPLTQNLKPSQLLALALIIALITPFPSELLGNFGTPNAATIQTIRMLKIHEPVTMLDDQGNFSAYLGDNFRGVGGHEVSPNFDLFLKQKDINMILVTPVLQQDKHLNNPEFYAFLKNYADAGYTGIEIPSTDRRLLYKSSLLPAP